MANRVLDTSILMSYWRRVVKPAARSGDVGKAARRLLDAYHASGIVTPVKIEFIAGARNRNELRTFRVFVDQFPILDEGKILDSDWWETLRLADRVPPDGKPRHLADCLIRAIARRLNCEVFAHDRGFPA